MNTGHYPDDYVFVNEYLGSYGYSTGLSDYSEIIEFAPKIFLKLYILLLKTKRDFSNLFDLDEYNEIIQGIGSLNLYSYFKKVSLTADNYMAYNENLERESCVYLIDHFNDWVYEMEELACNFAYLILRFSRFYVSICKKDIVKIKDDYDSDFLDFIKNENSYGCDYDFAHISSPYFIFLETIKEMELFKENRRLSVKVEEAYSLIKTIGELLFYNPENSYEFFCREGKRPSFINLSLNNSFSNQSEIYEQLSYGVVFSSEVGGSVCLESLYFINVLLRLRLLFEELIDVYAEFVPRSDIISTFGLI